MRFVSDEPGMAGEQQGDLVSRLRAVIEAKDEQIAALTAGLEASRERERRLELRLAEMERRVMATRLLIQRAAWLKDTGKDFIRAASMAKLYATEAATYVTHQALQVHGGYGYVKEYAVERYSRDARVMEIYEGTSEIQRLVIARSMLRDGVRV